MRRLFLSIGVLCILSPLWLLSGCGGSSGGSSDSTSVKESDGGKRVKKNLKKKMNMEEEEEDSETNKKKASSKKGKRRTTASKPKKEETPPPEPEEEMEERLLPENFADWTQEDYLLAKKTQFPDLDRAMAMLGRPLAGTEKAADGVKILLAMMERVRLPLLEEIPQRTTGEEVTEEMVMAGESEKNPMEVELVQMSPQDLALAVEVLFANGSSEAMEAITKLFRREILTDDDQVVVEAILKYFLSPGYTCTPEQEAMLFEMMLHTEKIRPALGEESSRGRRDTVVQNAEGIWLRIHYLRGDGQFPDYTPEEMRKLLLEQYAPHSSETFRIWIAQFLTSSDMDPSFLKENDKKEFVVKLLDFIIGKDPRNLEAQIYLYKQNILDEGTLQKVEDSLTENYEALLRTWFLLGDEKDLESYFIALDEEKERVAKEKAAGQIVTPPAASSLLGQLSREKSSQTKSRTSSSTSKDTPVLFSYWMMQPEKAEKMRAEIWSESMRKLLRGQMLEFLEPVFQEEGIRSRRKSSASAKDMRPLQMYLLIPQYEIRKEFYALLLEGWERGPEAYQKVGILDKMSTEPGFLMVVKSMERREPVDDKEKSDRKKKDPKKKSSPIAEKREQRQKTAEAWMRITYDEVCRWLSRWEQAAILQRATEEPHEDELRLPDSLRTRFPFPSGSEVVSFYKGQDPLPEGEKRNPDGLKVTYFHVRCHARVGTLIGNFRSKNSGLIQHESMEKSRRSKESEGIWLERFALDKETEKRESVDVLIVPKNPAPSSDDDKERRTPEDLDVYVLVMEMKDLAAEASP
ncbi:MAG: hypothetical protein Q4D62_00855 [Planctomycetia bacterium]|nr:hypothetical protein [Planctomycetia bacterium]